MSCLSCVLIFPNTRQPQNSSGLVAPMIPCAPGCLFTSLSAASQVYLSGHLRDPTWNGQGSARLSSEASSFSPHTFS